jgi:hypothetical protein
MAHDPFVLVPTSARSADERWAAWVAKGIEHDRRVKDRAIVIAIVAAGALALWATIALVF